MTRSALSAEPGDLTRRGCASPSVEKVGGNSPDALPRPLRIMQSWIDWTWRYRESGDEARPRSRTRIVRALYLRSAWAAAPRMNGRRALRSAGRTGGAGFQFNVLRLARVMRRVRPESFIPVIGGGLKPSWLPGSPALLLQSIANMATNWRWRPVCRYPTPVAA